MKLFVNQKRVVKGISKKIEKLEKQLNEVKQIKSSIEAIVTLFQVVSPLQDVDEFGHEVNLLQNKKKKELFNSLTILKKHITEAGRCQYGMNRTEIGENVTLDNVFLGDVFGLWTKSARYFLDNEYKLKNDLRPDISKNPEKPVSSWWIINDYQCKQFIDSHVEGMLKQISLIKKVA